MITLDGALCAELPPHELARIFWPDKSRISHADEREARALCRQCPVIEDCAALAMALGDLAQGIWAGTNARERDRIRRQAAKWKVAQ